MQTILVYENMTSQMPGIHITTNEGDGFFIQQGGCRSTSCKNSQLSDLLIMQCIIMYLWK